MAYNLRRVKCIHIHTTIIMVGIILVIATVTDLMTTGSILDITIIMGIVDIIIHTTVVGEFWGFTIYNNEV